MSWFTREADETEQYITPCAEATQPSPYHWEIVELRGQVAELQTTVNLLLEYYGKEIEDVPAVPAHKRVRDISQ